MFRYLWVGVLGLAACLWAVASTAASVDVGQPAPPIDLVGTEAARSLSELRGKVVYLKRVASALLALLMVAVSVTGCSVVPSQAWEKGNLAQPEMAS